MNFVLDKGSEHDFSIYKNTAECFDVKSKIFVDKCYYVIHKFHNKVLIPKKNKKKIQLNSGKVKQNREINKARIRIEHAFGILKIYKMLSTRYQNHFKNLILDF
ncbi:transposase family protein [uncultured Brachyspira sp.]|uniref:transposase family protein n=1 Tax=uncultured Brachyspira sp. TaxID=221953 RepID=UPI00341B0DB8